MLFVLAGVALTPVSGRTVLVAESPHAPNELSLQEALLDSSVTQIVLSTDVFSTRIAEATPIFLTRNLTITSQNPKDPHVWDMQHKSNGISLCSTCILVLNGVVIAHDRRGSGPIIDMFTGELPVNSSQLATILLVSSIRKRQACIESLIGVSTVKAAPRSPKFPEGQQRAATVAVDFRGTPYNNSLHIEENAVRVEQVHLEGSGWSGGYDIVSVVLLAALSVACWHWRRRKFAARQHSAEDQMDAAGLNPGLGVHPADCALTLPSTTRDDSTSPQASSDKAPAQVVDPLAGRWRILHAYTADDAPGVPVSTDWLVPGNVVSGSASSISDMHLGPLLGAGSFGRVYKGTWRGLDVAIKVIDHRDGHEAALVGNEAKLLMSLAHENIVSDFGLSRTIRATHRTTETQGTITHMSPERLITGRMSAAGDVFSFGIMMWEAWTGEAAFKGLHLGQVCHVVVTQDARPEVPANMPFGFRQLMQQCWAKEPERRPTMRENYWSSHGIWFGILDGSMACNQSAGGLAGSCVGRDFVQLQS
eukprot:gene4756-5006_t